MKLTKITLALLFSIGTAQAEYQMKINLDSQNIRFINWTQASPILGEWQDDGGIYGCTNWSPAPSSINITIPFVQTATDCKQNQIRTVQNRKLDTVSGTIQNVGSEYTEQKTITVSQTRDAIGTKEYWIEVSPNYTEWESVGDIYDCTNWSPSPSTVKFGSTFTQTATDCKQDQTRIRQNREQESTTYEVVNVGEPIIENQFIYVQSNRESTGTMETWVSTSPTYTSWNNVGSVYECENWYPLPNTVTINKPFTQSSNDCKQNQERIKQDREIETTTNKVRNVGTPTTETQVVIASNTRTSVGTMETWISTTPSYTSWVNSGAISGCTNWSPAPSTVTIGQSFVQTATDCKQTQVRSKQNREIETTTNQIRNVGTPTNESQIVTVSSTRNATGAKETWISTTPSYTSWVNSGAISGCTNWSPATSIITIGQSFVQTATDCKQTQVRSRQNREIETTTNQVRNIGTPINESQIVTVSSTRNATGAKETWVATTPIYTSWVNTNALYGCTNWTPAGSTKTATATFTQTATNCSTSQSRTRQDRQQETTTLAYRNVGTVVTEARTLTAQTATRSYTVTLGTWTNTGGKYGCTNWSPATSTVTSGQSFTQTATDCEQNQTRSRVEKYVDHKSGATVQVSSTSESRTITGQSSTRSAVGTKTSKICKFSEFVNNETQMWYTSSASSAFWSTGYSNIPSLWIDVNTGKTVDIMGSGGTAVSGLKKISSTEFRYTVGSKTWRITRGSFMKTVNSTNYYQICFE